MCNTSPDTINAKSCLSLETPSDEINLGRQAVDNRAYIIISPWFVSFEQSWAVAWSTFGPGSLLQANSGETGP